MVCVTKPHALTHLDLFGGAVVPRRRQTSLNGKATMSFRKKGCASFRMRNLTHIRLTHRTILFEEGQGGETKLTDPDLASRCMHLCNYAI